MSDINITMDISDAIAKTQLFNQLTDKQQQALKNLITTTVNVNKAGQQTKAVVEAQISANQRLVQSVKQTKDGLEVVSQSIKATTDAVRRHKQVVQDTLSAANAIQLNKLFPTSGFDTTLRNQVEKIKTIIRGLDTEVVSPKVISDFISKINSGEAIAATGTLAKLRDQLIKLKQASTDSVRNNEVGSLIQNKFIKDLESQFNIDPSKINIRQGRNVQRAIENIQRVVAQNPELSNSEIEKVFDNIRNKTQKGPIDNTALRAAADELTKIIGLYERLRQEADRQSRINQNALDQRLQTNQEQLKNEQRVKAQQNIIRFANAGINNKLVGIDPSLNLFNNTGFISVTRRIAELGVRSQLTAKDLSNLYSRFNSGQLTDADAKYARLITLFEKLGQTIGEAKVKADSFNLSASKPPEPPKNTATGGQPNRFGGELTKIGNQLNSFIRYRAFSSLTSSITDATTRAKDFQIQLSLIRTISQESQQSFGEWEASIKKVSNALGTDLTDTAKAFYDTVSNQIAKGVKTQQFVLEAGQFARTVGSSNTDAVNLLSSAINAYNLNVDDTREISAKFFKTIDLGRIQAGDMANTFGRVAFVARDLGVDFNELLALLSTLTRSGVTTDDAITLITNGMNKLTKPTEETRKLLKSWGATSGEAAIQIKGSFTQVLIDMIDAAEKGQISLEGLFNEVRGEKFIKGFKNLKDQVQSDLNQIKNESLQTFNNAIDIRGESDADNVRKQINELKNALTTDLGGIITKVTSDFLNLSGGVDATAANLKALISIAIAGTAGWLAYKGAVLGVGLAQGLYAAATFRSTAAIGANTTAAAANAAVYRLHPLGAVVSVLATAVAYFGTMDYQLANFNDKLNGLDDLLTKVRNKNKQLAEESYFKKSDKIREFSNTQSDQLIKLTAEGLAKANEELDKTKSKTAEISDRLRVAFGSYIDKFKQDASAVKKQFDEIDSRVQQSSKHTIDFGKRVEDTIFNTQIRYASDNQAVGLIDRRIAVVKQQVATLFAQGSPEATAEAEKLSSELIGLISQRFDKVQQIQGRAFEQDLRSGAIDPRLAGVNDQGQVVRGVDSSPLQAQLREIQQFVEAQRKAARDRLAASKPTLGQQVISDKAKLREAEDAINDLNKFSLFDKSGAIRPEFRNKLNDQADLGKVTTAFDKIKERIKKNIGEQAFKDLGLDKLLQERLKNIADELSGQNKVQAFTNKQKEIQNAQSKLNEEFKNGRIAIQELGQAFAQTGSEMSKVLDNMKAFLNPTLAGKLAQSSFDGRGHAFLGGMLDTAGRLVNGVTKQVGITTPEGPAKEEAKARIEALKTEATQIQQDIDDLNKKTTITSSGIPVIDPEAIRQVMQRIHVFKESVKSTLRTALGSDNVAMSDSSGKTFSIQQIEELERGLQQQYLENKKKFDEATSNFERLKQTTKDIAETAQSANTRISGLGSAAAAAGAGIAAGLKPAISSVDDLLLKLNQVTDRLNGIKNQGVDQTIKKPITLSNVAPEITEPERRAYGGPIGSDTYAIYNPNSEYVMNGGATGMFYSQIQSMNNRGRTPTNFNNNVDVGGINLTVNESSNANLTGREILRQLKRELRRGTM